MKSFKSILVVGFLMFQMTGVNAWAAGPVTQAKAAELTLHRIERLVVLKKIEEAFQNKLHSLKLERIDHQGVDQPALKATVYQGPAADGSQRAVEVILTEEGRALSHAVVAGGGEPKDAPTWPDKDPATLAENALHHVLDNAGSDPKLADFNQGFTRLTLVQVIAPPGSLRLAEVVIEAKAGEPVLKINLRADGTVETAEILPRP